MESLACRATRSPTISHPPRILRQHDYYDILGVPRDVDEAGLKRQYRKLALQFHPDKNRAPKADEAFKGMNLFEDVIRRQLKYCAPPLPFPLHSYQQCLRHSK